MDSLWMHTKLHMLKQKSFRTKLVGFCIAVCGWRADGHGNAHVHVIINGCCCSPNAKRTIFVRQLQSASSYMNGNNAHTSTYIHFLFEK